MSDLAIIVAKVPEFRRYISDYGSIGIFIWFITFNQINPIPSEISLLVIGYFIAHQVFNPVLAGIACVAGFVGVDVMYYYLSRSGSAFIKNKLKKSQSSFVKKYKTKLKSHMLKSLMILTFIPRVRMIGPILIGGMKLPFKKFLLFDTIGVALFTTVYLAIGILFHKTLSSMLSKMHDVQNIIFIAALAIIAMILVVVVRRVERKKTA